MLPAPETSPRPATLSRLFCLLAGLYVLSSAALFALGRRPALPWVFIPFLLLIALPIALSVVCGLAILPERRGIPRLGPAARLAGVPVGLALVWWSREYVLWLFLTIPLLLATRGHWTLPRTKTLVAALCTLTLGYGCVWNGNYLTGLAVHARLQDHVLVAIDLVLLRWMRGTASGYDGVFPLVTSPWLYRLLENAYALLFAQVLAAVLLLSTTRPPYLLTRWMFVLFGGYAAGLLVFLVFPAVGPPIYQPGSFREEWGNSWTFGVMTALAREFQQLKDGGELSGFGYFVAFPSLHVALCVFLQHTLRPWPTLFWTWLPISVLVSLSTVLLGFHYVVDLPAGLLLGAAQCRVMRITNAGPSSS